MLTLANNMCDPSFPSLLLLPVTLHGASAGAKHSDRRYTVVPNTMMDTIRLASALLACLRFSLTGAATLLNLGLAEMSLTLQRDKHK
jgi:hypothetical protein